MSVVRHPYDLSSADGTSNVNEPAMAKKFAVVEFSGRQYKIAEVRTELCLCLLDIVFPLSTKLL